MNAADSLRSIGGVFHDWGVSVLSYIPHLLLAVVILSASIFLSQASRKMVRRWLPSQEAHHGANFASILGWFFYAFFLVSGVFLALDALELTGFLLHFLAGAGIVGIIAGFALQTFTSNLFAGFLIQFQRPFKVGDWIMIDGQMGRVHSLSSLTVCIKNVPGQLVFIPNQLVFSNHFLNFTHFGKWRVEVQFGVSYGDDLAHVKYVTLDELEKIPMVLKDEPIDMYFTGVGASTYNLLARCWIEFSRYEQYLEAVSQVVAHLKKRYERENITVAYNVMTLDFSGKGGKNLQEIEVPVHLRQNDNVIQVFESAPSAKEGGVKEAGAKEGGAKEGGAKEHAHKAASTKASSAKAAASAKAGSKDAAAKPAVHREHNPKPIQLRRPAKEAAAKAAKEAGAKPAKEAAVKATKETAAKPAKETVAKETVAKAVKDAAARAAKANKEAAAKADPDAAEKPAHAKTAPVKTADSESSDEA